MVASSEIEQRGVWWANLPDPLGSASGFRRPVIVIQSNELTKSRSRTVLCVPLTTNLKWGAISYNLPISASATGLPADSVAMIGQILAVDKSFFIEHVGQISRRELERLFARLDVALGRW
jgi:mRNA interferase MazF